MQAFAVFRGNVPQQHQGRRWKRSNALRDRWVSIGIELQGVNAMPKISVFNDDRRCFLIFRIVFPYPQTLQAGVNDIITKSL